MTDIQLRKRLLHFLHVNIRSFDWSVYSLMMNELVTLDNKYIASRMWEEYVWNIIDRVQHG